MIQAIKLTPELLCIFHQIQQIYKQSFPHGLILFWIRFRVN